MGGWPRPKMSSVSSRPEESHPRALPDPCMNLSIHTAPEATLTIAADPKHLGASIGITAVLHTWGSALTHHPRVAHDRAGGWHL